MINDIICKFSGDPTLKIIGIIIVILIALLLIKRIAKIVKWLILIALLIGVYIFFTSDNPSGKAKELLRNGKKQVEQLKDDPGKLKKEIEKNVKEKAEELKEKVEKEVKDKIGQD